MARRFIGELILKMQDQVSGKAKTAEKSLNNLDKTYSGLGKGAAGAKRVNDELNRLERTTSRFAKASWGSGFQRQVEKLSLSKREIEAVGKSWNRMINDVDRKSLSKAVRRQNISSWKTATVSHFAQIRAEMGKTEARHKRLVRAMRTATRPAYIMAGGYTGAYIAGVGGRAALGDSSRRQREVYRQRMSGLPEKDRESIRNQANSINKDLPSVDITQIMEWGRSLRAFTGDTKSALPFMRMITEAFVSIQSVKGVDAAGTTMQDLVKALDILGRNNEIGDPEKIKGLIDALIKASQIDPDFDLSSFLPFARRAKLAGPGLSDKFLGAIAPSLIQEGSGPQTGVQLGSAFQNFIVGTANTAGKKKRQRMVDLGLRDKVEGGTLKDAETFGANPYEWVKKNLMPVLEREKINPDNETAVAQFIGGMSSNQNVIAIISKMITQRAQIERNLKLYDGATGLGDAENARNKDPFVTGRAFRESLSNFSSAIGENLTPVIIPGLNAMTDTINSLSQSVSKGSLNDFLSSPGGAVAGGIAGAGAAYGAYKGIKGIGALMFAGPRLITAADRLILAANAMDGGGILGDGGDKDNKRKPKGRTWSRWAKDAAIAGGAAAMKFARYAGPAALVYAGQHTSDEELEILRRADRNRGMDDRERGIAASRKRNSNPRRFQDVWKSGGRPHESGRGDSREDYWKGPRDQAKQAGNVIEEALSPKSKPTVDSTSIDAAISKAQRLKAIMDNIATSIPSTTRKADGGLRRAMSDYGVSP